MTTRYNQVITDIDRAIREFALGLGSEVKNSRPVATGYGVPYFAGAVIDGREMWGVLLDFGSLPNKTTKSLLIPSDIVAEWGSSGEHWIDTGNSFVYDTREGITFPLPHATHIDWKKKKKGGSDQISIHMTEQEVIITTESNRSRQGAVISIKYLKASV